MPPFSLVLQRLELERFRNHGQTHLEFAPGLNLFTGRNGQGKTNILEAIHYLAILRSFRARQLRELVQWGAEGFRLAAMLSPVADGLPPLRLAAAFGKERALAVNGAPIARGSEFIHRFLCVAFIPEDIALVRGPSADRRRFLDILVSQLDPTYLHHLHRFHVALKSRNSLLRSPHPGDRSSRQAWDRLLLETGAEVICRRQQLLPRLEKQLQLEAASFFRNDPAAPAMGLRYEPGTPRLAAATAADRGGECPPALVLLRLEEALAANSGRDEREGMTTWGPQRDDLGLLLANRPLEAYGSEGQCRAMALLLRLAAAKLLHGERKGLALLVDDVLGELDQTRRAAFWELLPADAQIFFTCTEPPPEAARRAARQFQVTAGTVA
ncbi:MAG: DNA replication and repair protein RecF [Lentisphaeria bacterium]|jgi:DNA replication and repair protein RecF